MKGTWQFRWFVLFMLLFVLFSCNGQISKENKSQKMDSVNEQIRKSTEDFLNRPIYKVLTGEIIDKTPDDQLLQVVFDNLSEKLPKDFSKEYTTVLTFSKPQQAVYVIWGLQAEINNGGFNQYYFNSSGQFAKMTPGALRLVGATKFADLVAKANGIFEIENKKITKHQDGTLEGFSKSYNDNPLNHFDDEFYKLYKTEELDKLQIEFIRKNKNDFIDK